ncbi:hypothetical protein BS78_08G169500 [Paspalum vaginatum]|nr:hypothetical protein BS78_08G169500 [Paspalum vaginatum]
MGRGGRSSGGGGRSRSFPTPRAGAPAPSSSTGGGGGVMSFFGRTVSYMFEGWGSGAGASAGNRAADAVFGPRIYLPDRAHSIRSSRRRGVVVAI